MWLKLTAFCVFFYLTKCNEIFSYVGFKSYLCGILNETLTDRSVNITPRCKNHLFQFLEDLEVDKLWAMQMLDSFSKIPSGILQGNVEDLGTFDECISISKHFNKTDYITGKYCLGKIPLSLSINSLRKVTEENGTVNLGLASCFPDSCSRNDIETVYKSFSLNVTMEETNCQTLHDQPQVDVYLICGIIFFGVVALIVLSSTTYEVVSLYKNKESKQVLKAFSLLTNCCKIFRPSKSEEENRRDISCIHGIRVLAIIWVLLNHRLNVQEQFLISNQVNKKEWLGNPLNMVCINGQLAIDTFFLISGAVITYSYKMYQAENRTFKYHHFILCRYLRLTPALLGVVIFCLTLLKHLNSGPHWMETIQPIFVDGCKKFWWKTLLYFQNYVREPEICVPHGWYLSADFQLYLISPAFIFLFKYFPRIGKIFFATALLCSIIACFSIGWVYELNTFIIANFDFQKKMDYLWEFHFPAYTRASTWVVGLILGYYIYRSRMVSRIELKKSVVITCWVFSVIIMFVCLFGGTDLVTGEYNRFENSLHMALVRPHWAMAISWIILACVNGYGGLIDYLLSMYVFKVLSRLTYSIYLVHYVVIYVSTTPIRTPAVLSNSHMLYAFCGDFVFSVLAALVLCLCFELPMIPIERHFIKVEIRSLPIDVVPQSTARPPNSEESYELNNIN